MSDLEKVETRAREIFGETFEEVRSRFEKEGEALLFETESYYNTTDNNTTHIAHEIDELLHGLEEEYLRVAFTEAMLKLQKAEQGRDSEEIKKYLEECQRISQKINQVKRGRMNT